MDEWSDRVHGYVLTFEDDEDKEEATVDVVGMQEDESTGLALAPETASAVKHGRLSLTQAEDLANEASGYYVSPPLCRDLDRVIARATAVENQVPPLRLLGYIYPPTS